MKAIFKRELSSYFNSAIGYIYLAVFYLVSGYLFYSQCLVNRSIDLRPVFSSLFTIFIVLIPLLTMRLMSEDKKLRTDQALLTAPITLSELVLGKFLSAFFVFFLGLAITPIFALFISVFTPANWAITIGCFFGALLAGGAMIAVGMFISQLTENQVIAAVSTFVAIAFFTLSDSVAVFIPNRIIKNILLNISFSYNYVNFATGILNFANIIFYLSIMLVFVFLTIRVIDKKRWSR